MKALLIIGEEKELTVQISYEDLGNFVSNLEDDESNTLIFQTLARHPSARVRAYVASKDKLDGATVEILANDLAGAVTNSLVRSDKARKCITTEQLITMLQRDIDTAESIASNLETFAEADGELIALKLANCLDPCVRYALASNSRAPKKTLRFLVADSDPKVSLAAKKNLAN